MWIFLLSAYVVFAWNYEDQNGWPDTCKTSKQSPVDLATDDTEEIEDDYVMKMLFLGETKSRTIVNTGNMIRIEGYFGYIEVGTGDDKRAFEAKAIEFHVPSEHRLEGVQHPMEMQVILNIKDRHWERDKANMAIVSVVFMAGIESDFFNSFEVWNLPAAGKTWVLPDSANLNVAGAVWSTDDYYFYKGTGTHPDIDCQNDVLWYIIEEIKEAKDWQIAEFTTLFPKGNAREIDEDHNPDVYYSSGSMIYLTLATLILLL